ncbi:hypothetical protein [Kitasatospora cinereorecta]|uniref:Uncharacterized protein n=1 Tax=Kitasatospora cinereorecta TaxID=285560 RepID=A0ABW0VM82_9ACTN
MGPDTDEQWRRWIAPLLANLAADEADHRAWADHHGVGAAALADDAEFAARLAERGVLRPQDVPDLHAVARLCRALDGADAPTAEAVRAEARILARSILTARTGSWHHPLPRRVLPQRAHG